MKSLSGKFSALCAFLTATIMTTSLLSFPSFGQGFDEDPGIYDFNNVGSLQGSGGVNITPLITEGKVGGQGVASYIVSFAPVLSGTNAQTVRGVVVRIPSKYEAKFTLIGVGPSVSDEQVADRGYVGIFNDEDYKLNVPMTVLPQSEYEANIASGQVTNIPAYSEAKAIGDGSSSKIIAVEDFQGNDTDVDDPSSREYGISTSSRSVVAVRVDIPVDNLGEGDTYIPISADQRWRCFSPQKKSVGSEKEQCHETFTARTSPEKFKLPTTITTSDFDEHGLITAAPACIPTRNMGSWSKVTTDVFNSVDAFRYVVRYRLQDNPAVQYRGSTELEDGCDIAAAIITTKGTKKFPTVTYPDSGWERYAADNVHDFGGNVDITPTDPPKRADADPSARVASFLVSMQFLHSNTQIQTSKGIAIDLPKWVKNPTFTLVGTQSVKDGVLTPKDVQGYTLTTIPQEEWEKNLQVSERVAIPSYEEVVADQAAGVNSRVAVVDAGVGFSDDVVGGSHRYRVGTSGKIYSAEQPKVVAIRVDVPIPAGMESEKYIPMRAFVESRCFESSGGLGGHSFGCQSLEEYQKLSYLPASNLIKPGDFDEDGFYWGTCAVTHKSPTWSTISYDVSHSHFLYPKVFRLADNPDVVYGSATFKEDSCDQAVSVAQLVYEPQATPTPSAPTQEPTQSPSAASPTEVTTPSASTKAKVEKAKKAKKLAFTGAANLPLIATSVALVVIGGGTILLVRRRRR